ncbi:MAG TPA: hypothetical protein VIJ51_04575 [Solirubrobacteraceae bacterium]
MTRATVRAAQPERFAFSVSGVGRQPVVTTPGVRPPRPGPREGCVGEQLPRAAGDQSRQVSLPREAVRADARDGCADRLTDGIRADREQRGYSNHRNYRPRSACGAVWSVTTLPG